MIETTKYYDEFIRYFHLAKDQQEKSNLGHTPHIDSQLGDPLMENIELYDVVERKFAGFSQIVNDCFYGWSEDHPYWSRMEAGLYTHQRKEVATNWNDKKNTFGLSEWLSSGSCFPDRDSHHSLSERSPDVFIGCCMSSRQDFEALPYIFFSKITGASGSLSISARLMSSSSSPDSDSPIRQQKNPPENPPFP